MITNERMDELIARAHQAASAAPQEAYPAVFAAVLGHLVSNEQTAKPKKSPVPKPTNSGRVKR